MTGLVSGKAIQASPIQDRLQPDTWRSSQQCHQAGPLRSSLRAIGVGNIAGLVCPIGNHADPRQGAGPPIAVAAQLLIRRDTIAAAVPSAEHTDIPSDDASQAGAAAEEIGSSTIAIQRPPFLFLRRRCA
jgi:hypothetical protein